MLRAPICASDICLFTRRLRGFFPTVGWYVSRIHNLLRSISEDPDLSQVSISEACGLYNCSYFEGFYFCLNSNIVEPVSFSPVGVKFGVGQIAALHPWLCAIFAFLFPLLLLSLSFPPTELRCSRYSLCIGFFLLEFLRTRLIATNGTSRRLQISVAKRNCCKRTRTMESVKRSELVCWTCAVQNDILSP